MRKWTGAVAFITGIHAVVFFVTTEVGGDTPAIVTDEASRRAGGVWLLLLVVRH